MVPTIESKLRTRAFARVIGPWLVIVPGIAAVRAAELGQIAASFFSSPILAWMTGALILLGGLMIIAFHQYWSGFSAIIISLFGWFLALRGFALMAFPGRYESAVRASAGSTTILRLGGVVIALLGLWLTYEGWGPARGRQD